MTPSLDDLLAQCAARVYALLPEDVGFVLVVFDELGSASVHSHQKTLEATRAVGAWLTQLPREETW